jgi:hypothetical protein
MIDDDDCGATGGMMIGRELTVLSRKGNRLLLGRPLLFTEYRIRVKYVLQVKYVPIKSPLRVLAPTACTIVFLKIS